MSDVWNRNRYWGGISMADFGIRFFICNILICFIIGILLMAKWVLRNHLTSRMQFNLWFLLLGLLAVPFLPVRPLRFSQVFLWFDKWLVYRLYRNCWWHILFCHQHPIHRKCHRRQSIGNLPLCLIQYGYMETGKLICRYPLKLIMLLFKQPM